jgi:hypothetical protein
VRLAEGVTQSKADMDAFKFVVAALVQTDAHYGVEFRTALQKDIHDGICRYEDGIEYRGSHQFNTLI